MIYAKVIGVVALVVAIATMVHVNVSLDREVDRLVPLAKKYGEICGGVKAALWVDTTKLHDTEDSAWLTPKEIEDDRKALFRRVGATIGGDDSYVMLQRCMPKPFPMDAWRSCIAANDNVCLRGVLTQAMDSIP